jgi:hypothetical protein
VRIIPASDGTVWFLIPSNDRIVQLQADGVTFKQWQIRDDNNIGANPVDFQVDGTTIWFIENGESQIDAGYSAFGRLDTTTGALHEWVVPGSKPAAFYRTPDGNTVWLPQTNGRLQAVNLNNLQVTDYRSPETFAYADAVLGPDGALWLADFGDNRIVRYELGAKSETSWTFYDPNTGRLNPSQIRFDDKGKLWMSMFSGSTMNYLDPATGTFATYAGFISPFHFDIFNGVLYITEAAGLNGTVVTLDPTVAIAGGVQITPQTNVVVGLLDPLAATTRDTTITPTTFTTTAAPIAAASLVVTVVSPGAIRTQFPSVNAFGLTASGGDIWVGTDGNLAHFALQTIGSDADLTVPVASQFGVSPGPRVRIDVTLSNTGNAAISGNALFQYSPGAYSPQTPFTVNAGQTLVLTDAFQTSAFANQLTLGPVRIQVTTGNAANLLASVRTVRALDDGSTFGYAIPAVSGTQVLSAGASRTLFLGARGADETAILGFFSPKGGNGTATLVAPDGTIRGTLPIHLAANVNEEFNPAASAFGVTPEPGDVVRLIVDSGGLEAYVNVLDANTNDVASGAPVAASSEALIPNIGTLIGHGGTNYVSDLFLSNPDPSNTAHLTISFLPVGSGQAPEIVTLTLPPGQSRAITDMLPTLFMLDAGQGTVGVKSDVPVAATRRVAARTSLGDYGTFAPAIDIANAIPNGGAAVAFGAPQTPTRRTHLLLYNHGAAGNATVIGYDATGTEVGRLTVSMGAKESARVDSVFAYFGVTNQTAGRIRVETTSGMQLFGETAEVDVSGDVDYFPLHTVN